MVKPAGMPRHVLQVANALHKEFDDLIVMSDAERMQPQEFERKFLSRAMAALVARKLTGCSSQEAADCVIDGRSDLGIDAVAFADGGLHLLLIQTKWKDKGTAGFGVDDALKFDQGLRLLDQQKFERFNSRLQQHAEQLKSVLADPQGRITLVVALMGEGGLSAEVVACFHDLQHEFNTDYDKKLDYDIWSVERFWHAIRDDLADPLITLPAHMDQWMPFGEPYEAYQGRVSAGEIAQWHEEHGDRLFSQNIRRSLGLTEVNHGLVETLIESPQDFWYFNNGITILCDLVVREAWSPRSKGPLQLKMEGASVVNGAQTVAAAAEANRRDPEATAEAFVSVKIITTRNTPAEFGRSVTRATNTQNRVERRDIIVALDPKQTLIREDFALSLDKAYTFRRGEPDPLPEAGCSVIQAAIALACAHRRTELTVRAKRSTDLLWETDAYRLLFDPAPSAYQIWHSVLIMRAIGAALQVNKAEREGRVRAIADHADYLVTHIIFQHLDLEGIDGPDFDIEAVRVRIPELAAGILTRIINGVDREFGPTSFVSSTFASPERCVILTSAVLREIASGQEIPELPADYRPPAKTPRARRPNAVPTLVDADRLADGTMLEFECATLPEREAVLPWLAEDARRGQAAWVNERSKPLVWAVDGRRYSPTGLVTEIWNQAGWDPQKRPVAVQGPSRWVLPGQGSLWQLALKVLADRDDPVEE
ncbi:hypothetical protein Sme01_08870 [Sphaerisporangium melleum]|uniref:Abortive phage infection protein C-terminal domain-containing protein n=1 Tax=Sphaerisporangium melleum TaxID=321316 RepID=A0A917QVT8_9ACTN|nr:AIPR family protein [Sphaerisporangium melleum]GGK71800.1 hypothetical protein GCM10007964_13320 [Sphaerisporangium melleum]GII68411.1 hypothetical protein Sme01_08870 [Sphaerisporangium melleum]